MTRPGEDVGAMGFAWTGALACFVIAGLTGVLFRFGIAYGWTAGLGLVNVRHAHSHLMYFGWVTPALMAFVAMRLPGLTGLPIPALMRRAVGGVLVAALASYPFYLAFGYTPVDVGDARLPLSVIVSSLNVLCWYAFVWSYRRTTRGVARTQPMLLWDLALTFLVLASLGGWALALLKPLGITDTAWVVGLTHVFLDLFSEGWFVLGVLGLFFARAGTAGEGRAARAGTVLVVLGLPVTFALGMPQVLVPEGLQVLARIGGALVAAGLLTLVAVLWRGAPAGWRWRVPLVLLALKALAELAAAAPGVWWATNVGLRVLYLHLMLLGFVSLGLVGAAEAAFGPAGVRGARWYYAAVLLLLASLLPLTTLWPAAWVGRWGFVAAAWIALGPVLAAAAMLAGRRTRRVGERRVGEGRGVSA